MNKKWIDLLFIGFYIVILVLIYILIGVKFQCIIYERYYVHGTCICIGLIILGLVGKKTNFSNFWLTAVLCPLVLVCLYFVTAIVRCDAF